jgi:hypothetical protein
VASVVLVFGLAGVGLGWGQIGGGDAATPQAAIVYLSPT